MDRIDAMRAFVAVVSEGAFTRAAERLMLSPQLISKYVSQLEKQLGVRLLNRTTRKVNVTEAGRYYYERLQQLLGDIDDLESELGDLQREARGQLRISAPVSFAMRHLTPLLCDFQKRHPAVGIDLQLSDRKVDIVEEGFDVALRIGRLKSSSLIAKWLAPVRMVVCASPEYLVRYGEPVSPEDLRNQRYLHYSYTEDDLELFGSGKGLELLSPGQGDFVSNNGDVLLQAAIEGAGLTVQPTFICGPAIAEGRLKVVLPDFEPEPMGLFAVYAHRQLLASKVRRFIDFLDGYFGSPPYWDDFS